MAGNSVFEMWTWMVSLGFLAILRQFIPSRYISNFKRSIRTWVQNLSPYMVCDVPEYENGAINSLYQDVELYLSSMRVEGAQHVTLSKAKNAKALKLSLASDERTYDRFDDAKFEWVHIVYERSHPMSIYNSDGFSSTDQKRYYILHLRKSAKERILEAYMKHIETKAQQLRRANRSLKLFTNTKGRNSYYSRQRVWDSVSFRHPATFDTLALDGDLRTRLERDLDCFAANESYYRRVGKAWKRGYLLYGPPGTGKSSMIAAIANKMRYDVYDLELTEVESNSELRKLLLSTADKSVIVIEDIDCSLDLSGQRKKKKKPEKNGEATPPGAPPPKSDKKQPLSKVTLSGLLNFVDGLWSSCGSERIFIFTTNHHEKLDPALLRAGRMDMHVLLSYCTFSAFKVLAKNYMQLTEHEMFDRVEKAFEGSFMTPADVAETLIRNQDDPPETVLEKLITGLGERREDPRLKPDESHGDEEDEVEEQKVNSCEKGLEGKKNRQDEVKEGKANANEKEVEGKENQPVAKSSNSDTQQKQSSKMDELEIKSTDENPTSELMTTESDESDFEESQKQKQKTTEKNAKDSKEFRNIALKDDPQDLSATSQKTGAQSVAANSVVATDVTESKKLEKGTTIEETVT